MEVWARLILYNFCSIVTGHVVIEKKCRKHTYQVNYTSAYKICHYVLALHNGESPPETESLIGKWILPIRPDRNMPASIDSKFLSALHIALDNKADDKH